MVYTSIKADQIRAFKYQYFYRLSSEVLIHLLEDSSTIAMRFFYIFHRLNKEPHIDIRLYLSLQYAKCSLEFLDGDLIQLMPFSV
jgi:hypothetical protein